MHVRGISPLNAEPNLALVRAHARRTAIGRLAVVYQINPVPASRRVVSVLPPGEAALLHGPNPFSPKPLPQVTLGEALFMDSIIMGGVDGEDLPMTLDLGVKLNMQAHAPGALVDVVG
jgi:hypothetical protein